MAHISLSAYCDTLNCETKKRYKEKVILCGFDPFALKKSEFVSEMSLWPNIQYPDIVNYLVIQTSWATNKQMKAYKSLQAYNFFVSGWVNDILIKPAAEGDNIVIFARVNHSQRARETPLKTWVLAEKGGSVVTAHCDCMAGLSEACSHIGAVLFAVETGYRMYSSKTCTEEKSKWLMPAHVKEVPYCPVKDIDFSSAQKKHKMIHESQSFDDDDSPVIKHRMSDGQKLKQCKTIENERKEFFKKVAKSGARPVILSLVAGHNMKYKPKSMPDHLPKPLSAYYQQENIKLTYGELMKQCDKISSDITLTDEQCKAVEKETRKQSNSATWFRLRAGRITASRLKNVCCTNPANPAKSLMKVICYPEAHKFTTQATKWGCLHEKEARDEYHRKMNPIHEKLNISDCGLFLNPEWPHLGASPDGLVSCECCGNGVCEVKCPYCCKDCMVDDVGKKNFCLKISESGPALSKKHAYYYQVQAQIHIARVDYCDFIVWTPQSIHIERILPDQEFWEEAVKKATHIFRTGILPELLGKWFTRSQAPLSNVADDKLLDNPVVNNLWCFCKKEIPDSVLIGCDNDQCKIQWYHLNCVKLQKVPKGEWYCPRCKEF